MTFFKDFTEGKFPKLPRLKQRATLTTSPIQLHHKSATPYYCYGSFPRCDGGKLRHPPQCSRPPALTEAIEEPLEEEEEEVEVEMLVEGVMVNAVETRISAELPVDDVVASSKEQLMEAKDAKDKVSPPQNRGRAPSRGFGNSHEWNQTMDAKLLFGRSASNPMSDEDVSEGESTTSSPERGESDFYEHDFKVYTTRSESDMNMTPKPTDSPTATKPDEKPPSATATTTTAPAETTVTPATPTPAASRWSRVSTFSLKSASQAAAAAASASVSAVNLASAAAAKAAAASAKPKTTPNSVPSIAPNTTTSTTVTPPPVPPKPARIADKDLPEVTEPVVVEKERKSSGEEPKSRPPLTKWDPSSRSTSTEGRSSLWDKSALALDANSRNRFSQSSQIVRRRSSETSMVGPPIDSPPLSRRGSLRLSDTNKETIIDPLSDTIPHPLS
jgi:hypothetical protein